MRTNRCTRTGVGHRYRYTAGTELLEKPEQIEADDVRYERTGYEYSTPSHLDFVTRLDWAADRNHFEAALFQSHGTSLVFCRVKAQQ
jgi:hypothetical protein